MPFEMVNADERNPQGITQSFRVIDPDQQGAGQSGPRRDRDGSKIAVREIGHMESLLHNNVNGSEVGTGG